MCNRLRFLARRPATANDSAAATPEDEQRRAEIQALQTLVSFMHDRDSELVADTAVRSILRATTVRATNTTLAIANLLILDSTEQAQMLCRSLFEDMAVVHWLIMQDDPSFLTERFFDSQDAAAIHQHEFVNDTMGLPLDLPEWMATEALSRHNELRKTFGTAAQHGWWKIDAQGKRKSLTDIVDAIGKHDAFAPRLSGGREDALAHHAGLANSLANQQLHHGPGAMPLMLLRDGRALARPRGVLHRMTAFNAFWTFGQIIYLQLRYGAVDALPAHRFEALYPALMSEVFARGMTNDQAADLLDEARSRAGSAKTNSIGERDGSGDAAADPEA